MDVLDFKKKKKNFSLISNFNERIKKQKLFIFIQIIRIIKKESVLKHLNFIQSSFKTKIKSVF
jgi:hypothetical protein